MHKSSLVCNPPNEIKVWVWVVAEMWLRKNCLSKKRAINSHLKRHLLLSKLVKMSKTKKMLAKVSCYSEVRTENRLLLRKRSGQTNRRGWAAMSPRHERTLSKSSTSYSETLHRNSQLYQRWHPEMLVKLLECRPSESVKSWQKWSKLSWS